MDYPEHYCLGTQVNNYLHKAAEDEECEPPLIIFENRETADKFRTEFAPNLSVFAVDPLDVFDRDFQSEEGNVCDSGLFLCIDVRDGEALCLDVTYSEFFERLGYCLRVDLDDEFEIFPLQHRQPQVGATGEENQSSDRSDSSC